jgi:hypothetical protein
MVRRSRLLLLAAAAIGLTALFNGDHASAGSFAQVRITVAESEWRPVLAQVRPVPRRERPTRTYKPLPP